MKFNSTQSAINALSEVIKDASKGREIWDENIVKNLPPVFAAALQQAGMSPFDAMEVQEVLRHFLTEMAASMEQTRHWASEAVTALMEARTRAVRNSGTSNFTV